jgi:multidrug efflux pump subunit AcrB
MAPIPANASAAMLFSFVVAMVIAPWLMLRLHPEGRALHEHEAAHGEGFLGRLYRRFATPVVRSRRSAWIFLGAVGIATVLVCFLFVTRSVTVKLLPFDNKSEMAVVVDLPEGAPLEDTERTLFAIAGVARQLPEIRAIETYAGTPAPFNFNGLVRHYYIRESPELGELHLNLAPRDERKRSSHEIALDLRARLAKVSLPTGTVARVVEVPPGPPVLATLLAEIYGPDSTSRRAVAAELKKIFASVPYIVDIDDSIGEPRPRLRISIDQDRLEFFGVEQRDVYDTIQALFGGTRLAGRLSAALIRDHILLSLALGLVAVVYPLRKCLKIVPVKAMATA